MKKVLPILMLLVVFGLSKSITAQVPQGINYQAVARNSSNQLLRQSNVNIEIAIHSGQANGPLVWAEYHAGIATDTFGLFTLVIGTGVSDSVGSAAAFSAINWASGSYYLQVYMSQVGHPTFSQSMGTDQLWSVPYALYAGNGGGGPTGATGATGPAGTNGVTGPTGANGINGATGAQGLQGVAGITGATGPSGGPIGPTGPTGAAGINGTNGATGATGAAGTNGTNGATGATGAAGTNGTNGATGATGATGAAGINGTNGATGATGVAGTNGTNGATGVTGTTGTNGTNGTNGPTGSQGPQGNVGPTGSQGAQGLQGNDGPTGAQGPQGSQGPQGPQGNQGSQGPQGPQGAANINGTTNYVVKFTGSTTGGNSQIQDDGTYVHIGTWTGNYKLESNSTGNNMLAIGGIADNNNTGVYGYSTGTGIGVVGAGNGAATSYLAAGSGVSGVGSNFGVVGFSQTTSTGIDRAGGYFQTNGGGSYAYVGHLTTGNVARKITGNGAVSTIVKDLNEKNVYLTCPEASEILFEDYGKGKLVNGFVHINIDPIFVKNVIINEAHPLRVFIQLEGDCKGVFITNKTQTGFDVFELSGGNSNTNFMYHIIANRADEILPDGTLSRYSSERFAPATGPQQTKTDPNGLIKKQ